MFFNAFSHFTDTRDYTLISDLSNQIIANYFFVFFLHFIYTLMRIEVPPGTAPLTK